MNHSKTDKSTPEVVPAISWSALYHLLLRRAWLLSACLIAALFAGLAFLAKTPKTYAARTVVQVEQNETNVINIQSVSPEEAGTAELLKTIEQNFMSKDLLLRVIKSAGSEQEARFLPVGTKSPASDEVLLQAATQALSVKLRRGTRLLDIVAVHREPEVAQLLAQSLVKEYLRHGFEQKVAMSQMANGFLLEEATRLKAKVEQSEHALQEYRESHDAVSLEEKQNLTVETLKELNERYNEVRGSRLKLEAEYGQAQQLAAGSVVELLTIPSVSTAPGVLQAKQLLAEKQVELSTLAQRYREEHPKFIQAQSQRQTLERELEGTVRKAVAGLKVEYEAAKTTEAKFQEALARQQKEAMELNRTAIPYHSLTRDVQSDQAMYDAVLKRLKETEVAKGVDASNIRMIESARVPKVPIAPVPARILGLSLLGGLTLGMGLIALLAVTDSSMRTVDEAEAQLGLPALAAVPDDRRLKVTKDDSAQWRDLDPHVAEAFRSLRTSLTVKNRSRMRIILFTSAVPAEGKSFCSVNTAIAFAQMGARTLLIDADLRRPRLAKILCAGEKRAGLAEHLSTGTPLNELITLTKVPGLHLLSAGTATCNPSGLLNRAQLAVVFAAAALAGFDRVIVDSAPINAVSDTLNLVEFCDAVCLVVRASATPKRAVIRAYHEIVEAGAQNVGLVLNRLPRRGGADFYYYYSTGSYGGAVYGEDSVTAKE